MSHLHWLTDGQMAELSPFFPTSHGTPRVDDRQVLSGIISFNRNGLRWRGGPSPDGPHKTLYSRWKRWSAKGSFMPAGQVSDDIGAPALVSSVPKVEWPPGDRGYDPDWFREALIDKGIRAFIPGRKQRSNAVKYDTRGDRIEIMFGRLKDWPRVATQHDRRPEVFLSAIALAALAIYWLSVGALIVLAA
ncbi:transposase [Rhodobacteraceae bacterium CCMM004]|nr:transposase [Rhodobacteraceae bacterium CCMM004]